LRKVICGANASRVPMRNIAAAIADAISGRLRSDGMVLRRKVPAQLPDVNRSDLAGGATVNGFSSNIAYKSGRPGMRGRGGVVTGDCGPDETARAIRGS